MADEVVRRRRARAVARTVEEGEDDRGGVGRPSLGQLARVGRSPLGGQGLWPLSPFFCFPFFLFFQQLLPLLLATIDFAKLCHWPKQFQIMIGHCQKKIVRL